MKNDRLFSPLSTCSGSDYFLDEILPIKTDNGKSKIEAGQTYFGQMIAHDIVPSTSFKIKRHNVSPALNLDSMYGENSGEYLKNGEFEFNTAYCSKGNASQFKDLKRDKNYKAKIPEPRNDENIIISQLHLFWQRFHNRIYNKIKLQDDKIRFDTSRLIVTKIFHKIVVNDYLRQILHPEIYNLYFENDSDFSLFYKDKNRLIDKGIPVEFSHAAFRFGHTMVRELYRLNKKTVVETKDILNNRTPKYLPVDCVINWKTFFELEDINSFIYHSRKKNQKHEVKTTIRLSTFASSKIDTHFVKAMRKVPFPKKNSKDTRDIREINLDAGKQKKIPMGESVRSELLSNSVIKKFIEEILNSDIYKNEDLKKLTLWPYILKEAELNREHNKAHQLGAVGSIIIADVLKASMQASNLILNTNQNKIFDSIIFEIKKNQYDNHTKSKIKINISKCTNKVCKKNTKEIKKLKLQNEYNSFLKTPITMGYCINYLN